MGLTGAGVIIGVLDFNFNFSSNELAYAAGSTGINQTYLDMYEAQIGEESSDKPHGHAVAVFAAGIRNMIDTHGVAYNAKILAVDYFSGVNIEQVQQGGITFHVTNPYTYMTDRGARVINISIGYDDDDIISNPPSVSQRYITANPLYTLDRGAILVAASGNSGEPEPMLSNLDIMDDALAEGLLNNDPGAFIIVGSVDNSNVISDFSDRAGRAKNIYMVAPGEQVVFPFRDDSGWGLFIGDGTSFAAPHVSGAAAILFQRWPQLTGQAIANILFNTATDLGTPGTDDVYGRGMLNLRAAVEPVGMISTTISNATGPASLGQLGMILGPAFGDASPYPLSRVMGLDAYGRDYYYDLHHLVIDYSHLAPNLMEALDNNLNQDVATIPLGAAVASFYAVKNEKQRSETESLINFPMELQPGKRLTAFALQGNTLGWNWHLGKGLNLASMLNNLGPGHERFPSLGIQQSSILATDGTFAAASYDLSHRSQLAVGIDMDTIEGIDYHPNPKLRDQPGRVISVVQLNRSFQNAGLGIRLGAMFEEDTVLGSRGAGGFGISDGSTTGFLTLNGYFQLSPAISIEGRVESGITSVDMTQSASYFSPIDDFISTSWSVKVLCGDPGTNNSSWFLGLTQPLRVENAEVTAKVATHVDPVNALPVFESKRLSLTPSGREITLEAVWLYQHDRWIMQVNFMNRIDSGHTAGRIDHTGMLWLKSRF